jgi:hypothetical protein
MTVEMVQFDDTTDFQGDLVIFKDWTDVQFEAALEHSVEIVGMTFKEMKKVYDGCIAWQKQHVEFIQRLKRDGLTPVVYDPDWKLHYIVDYRKINNWATAEIWCLLRYNLEIPGFVRKQFLEEWRARIQKLREAREKCKKEKILTEKEFTALFDEE